MTIVDKTQYDKVATNESEEKNENAEIKPYGYGVRHVQALLGFICMLVNYIARGHLGVTIVAMIDESMFNNANVTEDKNITRNIYNETEYIENDLNNTTNVEGLLGNMTHFVGNILDNNNVTVDSIVNIFNNSVKDHLGDNIANDTASTWSVYRTYKWPKSTQEMALSSFFIGYIIMTMPFGLVTQRWGGKLPLQISLLVNGVISILTPWLTAWGDWKAICFCRIVQGLSQAGVYPGTTTLLAKWVPKSERGRLNTYVYCGSVVGTVVAFQVAGFLGASSWGWPSMFWAVGVICILTCILLTIFGAASPQQHKFVSEAEKNFILGRLDDGIVHKRNTPWRKILSSKRTWAALIGHVGSGTSFFFFFTQVASYLHYILGVDVKKSGLFSSLPYISNFLASVVIAIISEYCTNKHIISAKTSRIICNTIASLGMVLCFTAVSFIQSTTLAVVCLVFGFGAQGAVHTGWMVNYIDLAPNYSGAIMACGNMMMNVFILVTSKVVSNVVTDVTNKYQWRIVLFTVAIFNLITNAVFVTFISTDVQPWNDDSQNPTDEQDKEQQELKRRNS